MPEGNEATTDNEHTDSMKRGRAGDNGHKHNGNGFIESFRFAYLKAITGYDWTEENVRKLNQEIEKDVETPEVNKATTWPSVR